MVLKVIAFGSLIACVILMITRFILIQYANDKEALKVLWKVETIKNSSRKRMLFYINLITNTMKILIALGSISGVLCGLISEISK